MAYGDFKDLTRHLTKHYVIIYSKWLVIHSMMDIRVDFDQWSTNSFLKNLEMLVPVEGPELFLKNIS